MMRRIIFFALFTLASTVSFAQFSWNAKVGMNMSNWSGDNGTDMKIGYKAGVGTEFAFNKTWSFQPSLFLSSKGVKGSGVVLINDYYRSLDLTINQVYVELPLMVAVRLPMGKKNNVVLTAGPYLAYGVGGKATVKTTSEKEKVNTFGGELLDRFDAGLGFGVAVELSKFIVGIDWQYGLVKVQNAEGAPKNLNLSACVGYKF